MILVLIALKIRYDSAKSHTTSKESAHAEKEQKK